MTAKAFVLLSGGIDSATCLAQALLDFKGNVEAVSIDYGQRHDNEILAARWICGGSGISHHVIDLRKLVPSTMLTDHSQPLPNKSYEDIEGISPAYVPFRNGLMLSALASFVHGRWIAAEVRPGRESKFGYHPGEWAIYFGAHAEDAQRWAYPDCTPEFIGGMANAIFIGTNQAVRLHTPLQWLRKWQIINLGAKLGVPFSRTWSCYAGGEKHCGTCPTCRSRKQGFIDAGIGDPTEYAT